MKLQKVWKYSGCKKFAGGKRGCEKEEQREERREDREICVLQDRLARLA